MKKYHSKKIELLEKDIFIYGLGAVLLRNIEWKKSAEIARQ